MEVTKANLATYLAGLTPSATPYPIEITETVASDWRSSNTIGTVGNLIKTKTPSGVYLDLGLTVIPNSVTNMYYTYYNCTALTTAPIIPSNVINMNSTFRDCTALTTAPVIPSSVTNTDGTFQGCTALTTAPIIPSNVINMNSTFQGCTALTTAPIIPSNVINMNSTFQGCTALTTAPIIPSNVINMYYTFYNCTSLTTAPIIPSSVTNMGYTFFGCTSLTTAPIIPSRVTSLSNTFYNCTSLTTAPIIPSNITDMYYTFFGCTKLHTIQNFAVDVDNCNMTNAFQNCPALANIYVTTLSESSWHLLHTNTGATGTDYTIYNPDGTVAGSGTVAGTSQVLTLYGKSDELVISVNITPTLAKETATTQVQWHKSGLPYDDELMIFNAKNPDTVISNFITVNRAGEEFLGNASTATTATNALACSGNSATATLATQANAIKPLGNSIILTATPTSVTKIIKIASVAWNFTGTFNIRCNGANIDDAVKVYINGGNVSASGIRVVYGKNNTTWGIKKIVVTADTPVWNSNQQIYAEIVTVANYNSRTTLGIVENNYGTLTPSMTEVSSVEGTVLDSLSLDYLRGDISSYQHVFTKNIIGNLTGNADTSTAPFYQWKKVGGDLYRYVAGESPDLTYYWYKLCKITTAMTFDIEVVSDSNYSYRASYRLSVSAYTASYSVSLFNLGQAVIGQANLAVALDADGYLYIQTNAIWSSSLFVTLLYNTTSNFSITMDKLGYAPFGIESGFTPVKIITQTGGFRISNGVAGNEISPIINTDIVGNVTGNLTGNVTGNITGNLKGIETIRTSSSFSLSTYSDGKQLRIANTHATNTITCTLPSGQTMNGQASFTIAPDTLLEFELIGTAWKCVSNEWELVGTYTTGVINQPMAQFKCIKIEVFEASNISLVSTEARIVSDMRVNATFNLFAGADNYYGGVQLGFTGSTITALSLFSWLRYMYEQTKIYGMK